MTPLAVVTPTPKAGVHAGRVDGSVVLFNEHDRRLHVLNESADAVWSRLARPTTIGQLTDEVASVFGADPIAIRGDVERMIDRFVADGLVGDDRRPRPRVSIPAPAPTSPGGDPFRALDTSVRIHSSDTEVARWLDDVVAPLRTTPAPTVTDAWIAVDDRGDGTWVVESSSGTVAPVGSRVGAVLRAVSEINDLAVASVPHHAVFHAGAVARDGRAVVLPGASNRGKSTLTTALVTAGFGYLTDEAAAVDLHGRVRPFPKAIALDPGSFGLFPELAPRCEGALAGRIGRREWHLDPAVLGSAAGAAEVTAIVCPHWRAGATTRLARVSGTEALHTLLGQAFDFTAGGADVFAVLVALTNDVPVYRLGYGDLDDAVAVIDEVLA
ncbi:MAG: PqqD family peptide modification chaperone [Actinomycetota bacterium]